MKQSDYHVVSTWNFEEPLISASRILKSGGSSIEACLSCCRKCQELKSVESVGYGGSPNEKGETTLDAMIMNGDDMRVGCVGSLRRIKDAIGVAHDIMTKTSHSFLVGSEATEFASRIGYETENLSSQDSNREFSNWSNNECYPNYWIDKKYSPFPNIKKPSLMELYLGHDTIGVVSIDSKNSMACATSTNGMKFKIPGRVGDSPIPGAGSYVDSNVGGAVATGDGDVLLRFLPCYYAVHLLSQGIQPEDAAVAALKKIIKHEQKFSGAVVVLSKSGSHGAACYGFDNFSYLYASSWMENPNNIIVPRICI